MKKLFSRVLCALMVIGASVAFGAASPAGAIPTSSQITITSSIGVPDRGDTYRAYDGDTATETYTTPSNTTDNPSYLEFGFASTPVNRLRILKDTYVGPHDLTIQYSTSTASDLHSRTWTTVTHLRNGYFGTEPWVATSVNPNGTVTGDAQELADDFASVMFDAVTATGLRIVFTNTNPCCNHYHVYEFEAHYFTPPTIQVTSPNGGESWARGSTHAITWTFANATPDLTVRLVLRRNFNFARTIATSVPIGSGGNGSFNWTVPNGLTAGSGYRVRAAVNQGEQGLDVSDNPFRIT